MKLEHHDLVAANVLARYQQETGWQPALPVPVEQIIERVYGLRIDWMELPEDPGETILGALHPSERAIRMNERHAETVLARVGPRAFTFAHELGHWLYDVDQVALQHDSLFDAVEPPVFCRGRERLSSQAELREVNANKFAARLVLPRDLVVGAMLTDDGRLSDRELADGWGVSPTTLRIRFAELGVTNDPNSPRLL